MFFAGGVKAKAKKKNGATSANGKSHATRIVTAKVQSAQQKACSRPALSGRAFATDLRRQSAAATTRLAQAPLQIIERRSRRTTMMRRGPIDQKQRMERGFRRIPLLVWLLFLSARTFARTWDWKDQWTFFQRTIADGGDSARMLINLGSLNLHEGHLDTAKP
jgi:hypothetical protein